MTATATKSPKKPKAVAAKPAKTTPAKAMPGERALQRQRTFQRNRFAKLAEAAKAENTDEAAVIESLVAQHNKGFPQSDPQAARKLAVEVVSLVYHPQAE